MYNSAIKVLKILEENNFKAYIIGGFVRDKYLNITNDDIDICTNATPLDLKNIFKNKIKDKNYGSMILNIDSYNFEITTFRKELEYSKNRVPSKLNYIDTLEEDLVRRDFTINTMCIDSNNNLIDLLNAKIDLDNKIIKSVGNPYAKIEQDSLRILRAIRFATILNFKIDENLFKAIKKYGYLLKDLSFYRKKEELNKIFLSKNIKYGIKLIKKAKLDKYLDIDIKSIKYTKDVLGIWASINPDKYPFIKQEKEILIKINKLKKQKINNYFIYKNGIYISNIIADIQKKDITKIYNKLPIHNENEINIKIPEITNILNKDIISSKVVFKKIELLILNNKLNNNNEDIKKYIEKHFI